MSGAEREGAPFREFEAVSFSCENNCGGCEQCEALIDLDALLFVEGARGDQERYRQATKARMQKHWLATN